MHGKCIVLKVRQGVNERESQAFKPLVSHERKVLERQIAATDTEIDKLVYELYNLTEEEIRIVESPI